MSMGRGRNNDIQIKNDGKISRYHCRIFRRGDEFIIEDNKSSNGTLVDSKLVTRQRLDGGEQIQIGETRVIFQL
jgi:pSer/pThr/pTyr-binding forkhead associated (FHA) protein